MKRKYLFISLLCLAAGFVSTSCSESLDSPVLPEAGGITLPQAVPLEDDQLFGVWEAETSYGDNSQNYFEEEFRLEFTTVEDGEAVYSHWFNDAITTKRDSVCNMRYTFVFDGFTAVLTPQQTEAAAGAAVMTATHMGDNRLLLTVESGGITDSICTLTRTGDPEPSIISVNRTLPQAGEKIIVKGRNLQFVSKVFLPVDGGEVEVNEFTPGSKEISFVLPSGKVYAPGSIRLESESAKVSCFSPAYMFCEDCVFFKKFEVSGSKPDYTGSEFENTIGINDTPLLSGAKAWPSNNLPTGHSLYDKTFSKPEYLLSFFGDAPVAWPLATGTDDKKGFMRLSSGDCFQRVLDKCKGRIKNTTRTDQLAIQMDIYVESDGKPEWNTGYLSWRLNKSVNSLTSTTTANVAGWEKNAPMSFEDGWQTFTIPFTAFPVTKSGSYTTIGGMISQLLASKYQTILTLVNYPLNDNLHPSTPLNRFQFSIANIRLVPCVAPPNKKIEQ